MNMTKSVIDSCSRITELFAICQERASLHNDIIAKNDASIAKRANEIASLQISRNELFNKLLPILSVDADELRMRQNCFENEMRQKTQETDDLLTVQRDILAKFITHVSKVMNVSVIDHARNATIRAHEEQIRAQEEAPKRLSLWM